MGGSDDYQQRSWCSSRTRRAVKAALAALLVAAMAAGCSTSPGPRAYVPPEPDQLYQIMPGDEIEVSLFYAKELSKQFFVPPDGMIRMDLIGPIKAAGRTPEQVAAEISEAYKPYVQDSACTVRPRILDSRKLYVGGEVRLPGVIAMSGPATVPQAIIAAGGATDRAALNRVIIIHQGSELAEYRVYDLQTFLEGKGNPELPYLRGNDIVLVPKSSIANVNVWVDQYLRANIPGLLTGNATWQNQW